MQLENYRDLEGRRVRLNDRERDRLMTVVEDDTRKTLACGLMAHSGLRSKEVVDARREALYQSETGQWFVRVPAGKGNKERSTPTSATLAGMFGRRRRGCSSTSPPGRFADGSTPLRRNSRSRTTTSGGSISLRTISVEPGGTSLSSPACCRAS